MTYSIVARDPETGMLGVAVASRFFAVGAIVPHICGGVGAIATQAFASPLYGTRGMELLKAGKPPQEIIDSVIADDEGRTQRQVHLIDAKGRNAAFTGENCIDWAGHLVDDNVSVAGNMLAGPTVVADTLAAYKSNAHKPFGERLLIAMQAGEDAGGDKRGKQSAALSIYRDQDYPWIDIRADDAADPLSELRRLYQVAAERYLYFIEAVPTRQNISGMIDRSEIDKRMAEAETERARNGIASVSFATSPAQSAS